MIETLIGAAVGVIINLMIAPPLYIQPTRDAISDLAYRMGGYAHDLADTLRAGEWTRAAADHALDQARDLGAEVTRADKGLARTEQSARLNPLGHPAREAQPQLRPPSPPSNTPRSGCGTWPEHCWTAPTTSPADAADSAYEHDATAALPTCSTPPRDAGRGSRQLRTEPLARNHLDEQLTALGHCRDRLSALLLIDPHVDPAAWQQHGALLAAIDRIRVEIAAAARPADVATPALARPQRQAHTHCRHRRSPPL